MDYRTSVDTVVTKEHLIFAAFGIPAFSRRQLKLNGVKPGRREMTAANGNNGRHGILQTLFRFCFRVVPLFPFAAVISLPAFPNAVSLQFQPG
jgi:hypothetical protein